MSAVFRRSAPRGLAIVLVALSLAAATVVAELLVRLVERNREAGRISSQDWPVRFSASRHHELVPNAAFRHTEVEYDYVWQNNSLGMRDRKRPAGKESNAFRILFLGDSFVQGYGVALEDTLTSRLERSLNAPALSKEVEVVNAGVFGYSPALERIYLAQLLGPLAPDLVLVAVFPGNDVGDDHFYSSRAHRDSQGDSWRFDDAEWPWTRLERQIAAAGRKAAGSSHTSSGGEPAAAGNRRGFDLLLRHSALARLFDAVVRLGQLRIEARARKATIAAITRAHRNDIGIDLGLVDDPESDPALRRELWQMSLSYLAEIQQRCASANVPMALVIVGSQKGFEEPFEVLGRFARPLSIPVIELRPGAESGLFYELDGHWTPAGHRWAAGIVDHDLRRFDLLPPPRERSR